jgi:cytochrome P450
MTEQDTPLAFPFPPSPSLQHPSPVYAQLRQEQPVARITTPDGNEAWLVTRYADVRQVLVDPRFSRAAAAGPDVPLTGFATLASESMLGLDPPEHTRLRKLVSRAFTARRVETLRPRVAELVDELLTVVRQQPRPVDLVSYLSVPLPIQVISELLGIPAEDRYILHDWSDAVMGDWHQRPEELQRALDNIIDYFAELIAAKRAEPADDLMTALIAARDEQDRLSERELLVACLGLLVAGHATTVSEINMMVLALHHHPQQLAGLRSDPTLIPAAVEELLRFVQISAAGGTLPRVTTEEVHLGGVTLPAGAVVMQATTAANRDPDQFATPDALHLGREGNPHLSFGAGVHHCLGAPLARMELQETLRGLLQHLPGLRVAVPDAQLRFKRGMFIRSLEALPVTW